MSLHPQKLGRLPSPLQEQIDPLLESVLVIAGDMAHLQLFDADRSSLRIVSQRGFHHDFLHFFNTVHEGQAACGLSFHRGERVIVENVATAAIFQDIAARNVMLKAHARAVQSTPLLSSAGRPLGILSTHYRKPTFPSARELLALDRLAVRGAALVASAADGKLPPASPGYALPSGLSIFVELRS